MIPSKCFKPDMKYWQIEHAGRFHPKVLNQTWSTDKLNIQEDLIQKFWIRHEEQTSWTYRVIPSKSFVPDIKYWQVEHTGWFNTKVWTRHEVDKLNIQEDSIQKFWTEQVEHTGWFHPSSEPDMKNRQVEHKGRFHLKVLNQTSWTYRVFPSKLNIQGDSIQVLNQTWSTDKLNIPEMFKTVGPVGPSGLI